MQIWSKEKTNEHIFWVSFHQGGAVSLKNRPVQAHQRGTFWETCGTAIGCDEQMVEIRRNSHEVTSTMVRTSQVFHTLEPQKSRSWLSKLNLFLFTPTPRFSPPPPPRKTQKTSLEPSLQAPGGATKEHTPNKPPVPMLFFPGFPCGIPTYLPTTSLSPAILLPREAPSWTWTNGTCSPWPTRTPWEQGGRPGEQQLGVLQMEGVMLSHMSNDKKRAPGGCLGYLGDDKLPSYIWIMINHCKDHYETTSIIWKVTVFFFSWLKCVWRSQPKTWALCIGQKPWWDASPT